MSPHPARPLPFDGPFTARQAQAVGITPRSLAHRCSTGELIRLRRGVYAPADSQDPVDLVRAALLTSSVGGVVGFEAAAALHRIPLPHSKGMRRIDLYAPEGTPPGGGRPAMEVRMHYVELPPAQVTTIDGIAVTTLARTAIDVSRGQPLERAVVALDYVRSQGVRLRALWDARHAVHGQRGVAVLDQALRECSPKSESPMESISRLQFVRGGLPRPVLQREIPGVSGKWYRVDFCWVQAQVIGEADGALKYTERGALVAEKQREDDLRAAGWKVVRWTWGELVRTPEVVVTRVQRALRAGR